MADSTLHIVPSPTTRTLTDELATIRARCESMEETLLNTDAILRTILNEGMIDHLPSEDKHRDSHNRAVQLLGCARNMVDRTVDLLMDEPPTLALRDLLVDAKEGRLQRSVEQ